jgi:hypothetical protein
MWDFQETVESLLDNRLFGTRDLYILIDTKPSAEFEFYNFPDNIRLCIINKVK